MVARDPPKERGAIKEKPCSCENCLFLRAECKTIFEENNVCTVVEGTQ